MDLSARLRLAELVGLYVAAPGALTLVTVNHRWVVLPAIALGSLLSFALLWLDPTYPRSELASLALPSLPAMLARAFAVLLVLQLFARPSYRLPREQPAVFAGVLVLYFFLSAVPQEVMYRAFFFHRYRALFPGPASMIAASALAFGWAHVVVHNRLAMLLSAGAGLLLSITWAATQSLWLVGLEHWIYGAFVLGAGIGGMFVNGTRLVSSLLR